METIDQQNEPPIASDVDNDHEALQPPVFDGPTTSDFSHIFEDDTADGDWTVPVMISTPGSSCDRRNSSSTPVSSNCLDGEVGLVGDDETTQLEEDEWQALQIQHEQIRQRDSFRQEKLRIMNCLTMLDAGSGSDLDASYSTSPGAFDSLLHGRDEVPSVMGSVTHAVLDSGHRSEPTLSPYLDGIPFSPHSSSLTDDDVHGAVPALVESPATSSEDSIESEKARIKQYQLQEARRIILERSGRSRSGSAEYMKSDLERHPYHAASPQPLDGLDARSLSSVNSHGSRRSSMGSRLSSPSVSSPTDNEEDVYSAFDEHGRVVNDLCRRRSSGSSRSSYRSSASNRARRRSFGPQDDVEQGRRSAGVSAREMQQQHPAAIATASSFPTKSRTTICRHEDGEVETAVRPFRLATATTLDISMGMETQATVEDLSLRDPEPFPISPMTNAEVDNAEKCWTVLSRKAIVTVVVLVVLVVAAIVALIVGLLATEDSGDSDSGGMLTPRADGYLACPDSEEIPDIWGQCRTPHQRIRYIPNCIEEMHAALRTRLADYLPDDLEINSCDPTNMALLSIADATTYFDPTADATPNLLERFALTCLYFSTQGDDWYHTSQWLFGGTHCAWRGITCDAYGRVVEIDLSVNNLQGSLPSELALLSDLKELTLDNGDIIGSISSKIYRSLTNLERVTLGGNGLTEISSEIGYLRSLQVLAMDNNKFVAATLPSELGLLSNLTTISCSGCNLHGTIPAELKQCTHLKFISLDTNFLSGTLPSELSPTITYIRLGNNNFSAAPFPSSLFHLTKLTALGLSGNAFEGPAFPPEMLTSLTNLRSFSFDRMGWTGTIPTQIGSWGSSLETLAVGGNNISGTIPSEMGRLTSLKFLHLVSNDLTGTLPSELGALTDLGGLFMEGNRLDLTRIPTEVETLVRENGLELPNQGKGSVCC